MNIEFTKEEAAAAIQLADVAVRQAGLQAAGAALQIAGKFQQALDAQAKKDEADKPAPKAAAGAAAE